MGVLAFLSAVPSLIVILIWAAGLVLTLRHLSRGSWRNLAIAGFACLLVVSLLGLTPLMLSFSDGGYSSMIRIITFSNVASGILGIVGAGLLVTAVLTNRGDAARTPTPTPLPYPPPPN